MSKNKIILISIASLVLIIALIFFITNNSSDNTSYNNNAADKTFFLGNWVRMDASYIIKINNVNDDETLEAQYFNPNPINVGSVNWEESYGNLKVIIELRDVNYPGSTYTLNYLPDRDMLAGEYYQAVEGLTFYVEFTRKI